MWVPVFKSTIFLQVGWPVIPSSYKAIWFCFNFSMFVFLKSWARERVRSADTLSNAPISRGWAKPKPRNRNFSLISHRDPRIWDLPECAFAQYRVANRHVWLFDISSAFLISLDLILLLLVRSNASIQNFQTRRDRWTLSLPTPFIEKESELQRGKSCFWSLSSANKFLVSFWVL